MKANNIVGALSQEDINEIEAALSVIETKVPFLLEITKRKRSGGLRLGPKSLDFVVQTLQIGHLNQGLLPRDLELEQIEETIELRRKLQVIAKSVGQLAERMDLTVLELGSELMKDTLDVYHSLRFFGKSSGLDPLLVGVKRRFKKSRPADSENANADEVETAE